MAIGMAAEGCTVCGCARSADAVEELSQELGAPHQFDVVDIADDSDVKSWADSVLSKHGAPDFLINNAATINTNAPLWQVRSDEFDRVTSININGTANTIRHFVPAMVECRSGVIVNFSSGWGRVVSAEVAPYCASKWAIEGLTRALAEELPAGMVAVPLNPGIINTEMLQSCFGGNADSSPSAEDWANVAVPFILSLDATSTGEPLTVPGM